MRTVSKYHLPLTDVLAEVSHAYPAKTTPALFKGNHKKKINRDILTAKPHRGKVMPGLKLYSGERRGLTAREWGVLFLILNS